MLGSVIKPCPSIRPHGTRNRVSGSETKRPASGDRRTSIEADFLSAFDPDHRFTDTDTSTGLASRYTEAVLFLITAPVNNERGPRYMEKALASIHQARLRYPVSLLYGSRQEQIGLFIRCHSTDREAVLEPIVANYPECAVSVVDEWETGSDVTTWSCDVELVPELFPILRHAQFEDMLNNNFADPVSGLLRAIRPENLLNSRVEITIDNASRHRCHETRWAVTLLDRAMFRNRHWLATYFARRITRPRGWFLAWLVGVVAWFTPYPSHMGTACSSRAFSAG